MKVSSRQIFDFAFRALLVLLPFLTIVSIFSREILSLPGTNFTKELLLLILGGVLAWRRIVWKEKFRWTLYDLLAGIYIGIALGVSVFTTGFEGILYGGRYDFSFIIAFLLLIHGYPLLEKKYTYYIRLFLWSGGVMLFLSMLLKWPLSEDILLYFGYSGNPSSWQFGSAPPIFHGVEGANVRRFQGLLDGPNSMAAFLLLYLGVFVYYFREKKNWYFLMGVGISVFILFIFYTYSRSAALGLFGAVGFIILFSLRVLFQKYRVQSISIFLIFCIVLAGVFLHYAGNMRTILQRGGSTNGHIERMTVGMERFYDHPWGQGLSSAGPAYRHLQNLQGKPKSEIEEIDRFYIPESWYIQQLIETGIFGALAFFGFLGVLFLGLYRFHILFAAIAMSLYIMNFFLHTFESSVVSLSSFLLFGLVIGSKLAYEKKK